MRTRIWLTLGATVLVAGRLQAEDATEGSAPPEIAHLVERCAPQVHPVTMLKLIRAESKFQPFIIGVNGTPHQAIEAASAADAARIANALIKEGKNVDLGLGQINEANLGRLKLTVGDAFDGCSNIKASAKLLTDAYIRERPQAADDQAALDAALSTYNTGKPTAGLINGYVAGVRGTYTVPALGGKEQTTVATLSASRPVAPAWDVYGAARNPAAPAAAVSSATPVAPSTVMVFGGSPQAGPK